MDFDPLNKMSPARLVTGIIVSSQTSYRRENHSGGCLDQAKCKNRVHS